MKHTKRILVVWQILMVLILTANFKAVIDAISTLQFGGHYPIERINRIEIIRGPGSAMYGGNAEYAVINIITSDNSEFNGVHANVFNSIMSRTFASRGVSIASGKSIGKTHLNLSASLNESNRSQEIYTDFKNNSYDMSTQAGISNAQYRVGFTHDGFSLTGMYDAYAIDQRDGYDEIYLRPYKTEFWACSTHSTSLEKLEKRFRCWRIPSYHHWSLQNILCGIHEHR